MSDGIVYVCEHGISEGVCDLCVIAKEVDSGRLQLRAQLMQTQAERDELRAERDYWLREAGRRQTRIDALTTKLERVTAERDEARARLKASETREARLRKTCDEIEAMWWDYEDANDAISEALAMLGAALQGGEP